MKQKSKPWGYLLEGILTDYWLIYIYEKSYINIHTLIKRESNVIVYSKKKELSNHLTQNCIVKSITAQHTLDLYLYCDSLSQIKTNQVKELLLRGLTVNLLSE